MFSRRDRFLENMTSNMTHPDNKSSSTDGTLLAKKQLERSTTEEVSLADEASSWKGGLSNDNDVPKLLPEHDQMDLSDDLLPYEQYSDMADLSEIEAYGVQYLAAGSYVLPEGEDDVLLCMEESSVATQDSQGGRSRKRRYAHMKFETVKKYDLVGPKSVQMKVIKRIIDYLEDTNGEDPKLLPTVREVAKECERRHENRENKYRHLPGAIFEALVDTIGGPTFYRLYTKSEEFQNIRVFIKEEDEDDDSRQVAVQVAPPSRSIGVQNSPDRSVLLTGVAYGFHQARTFLGGDKAAVEKAIQEGEYAVSRMNEEQRNEFWEHFNHYYCLANKDR